MRARLTKLGAALAALAAIAVGASTFASAQQGGGSQPAKPPAATAQARDDGERSPAYRSSVTAPDREFESESAEAQALRSKATVSAEQARTAALAAVDGTAGEVELDNENGNVVYSVDIRKADGSHVDVKVDAGNAKVLHQEADDGDDAGEHEADDAPEGRESGR